MCDVSIGHVVYPTGAKLATKGVSVEKLWNILPDQSKKTGRKMDFHGFSRKKNPTLILVVALYNLTYLNLSSLILSFA